MAFVFKRRNDFIQIMVDNEEVESEGKAKKLTNSEIISQAVLFIFAGYETTSTALLFIAFNLASNPDAQNKLLKEIDETFEKFVNSWNLKSFYLILSYKWEFKWILLKGVIDYESLGSMRFMDAVINETLRLYPPAIRFDRVANKDYEYEDIHIPKGQIVVVPIYAIHHDPLNFAEPEKFIPERQNTLNSLNSISINYLLSSLKRFENASREMLDAFLPFGAGLYWNSILFILK